MKMATAKANQETARMQGLLGETDPLSNGIVTFQIDVVVFVASISKVCRHFSDSSGTTVVIANSYLNVSEFQFSFPVNSC